MEAVSVSAFSLFAFPIPLSRFSDFRFSPSAFPMCLPSHFCGADLVQARFMSANLFLGLVWPGVGGAKGRIGQESRAAVLATQAFLALRPLEPDLIGFDAQDFKSGDFVA